MNIDDIALRVSTALGAGGIPFMLVGGFSSNYYGIPRSTADADFVIATERPLNQSLAQVLGPDFESDAQLSFETNTGTSRQEFRVKGTMFKVEIFCLSNDPHDQERFRRRQMVNVQGCQVFFPTAEDVIVWKLRWGRPKDREDVRGIIAVQFSKLDWNYIGKWCGLHRTTALLEELKQKVPRIAAE